MGFLINQPIWSEANYLVPVEAVEELLGRKVVEPEVASEAMLLKDRLARERIRALYIKPRSGYPSTLAPGFHAVFRSEPSVNGLNGDPSTKVYNVVGMDYVKYPSTHF